MRYVAACVRTALLTSTLTIGWDSVSTNRLLAQDGPLLPGVSTSTPMRPVPAAPDSGNPFPSAPPQSSPPAFEPVRPNTGTSLSPESDSDSIPASAGSPSSASSSGASGESVPFTPIPRRGSQPASPPEQASGFHGGSKPPTSSSPALDSSLPSNPNLPGSPTLPGNPVLRGNDDLRPSREPAPPAMGSSSIPQQSVIPLVPGTGAPAASSSIYSITPSLTIAPSPRSESPRPENPRPESPEAAESMSGRGSMPVSTDHSPRLPASNSAGSAALPALPWPANLMPANDEDDLPLTPDEVVNVAVYEQCNRSVVNITSKGVPGERILFFETSAEGSGSGAVIDNKGHILTNYHVIEAASQVEVTLFDGSNFDATFVGADPVNDLAVIRIDAPVEKLFPINIGDSSRLKVGMKVFAIGNPFGLERTMTSGIISSLNRSLQIHSNRTIKAVIQTDAAVNPGNSGGPLIDCRGQLIGVNTAIATRGGGGTGVGFAVPATLVRRAVPQLIQHGRVIRPEIGIQQVLETKEGLLIAALTPGGPAERSGLRGPQQVTVRRGLFNFTQLDRTGADKVVAVDGETVTTADDFLGLIERRRPGDNVRLKILRAGQEQELFVTLAAPLLEKPQPVAPGVLPPGLAPAR